MNTIRVCGVILAAGESSRMGTDKALLPWPPKEQAAGTDFGHTLLSAAIAAQKPPARCLLKITIPIGDSSARCKRD